MNTRILFLIRNFTVDKMFLKKVFDNVEKTGANPDNFQRGGLRQFFLPFPPNKGLVTKKWQNINIFVLKIQLKGGSLGCNPCNAHRGPSLKK